MARGTHPERKAPTGLRAGSAAASVARLLDVWKPRAPSARPAASTLEVIILSSFRVASSGSSFAFRIRNQSGL